MGECNIFFYQTICSKNSVLPLCAEIILVFCLLKLCCLHFNSPIAQLKIMHSLLHQSWQKIQWFEFLWMWCLLYHKASNTPKTYVPRKGYVGSLQDSPQDSWSLVKMYKDKILNYSSCRTWMILHKSIKNRKNKNMWRRTKFRTVVPHLRLISWRDLHKILDRMCYQKEWILGKPKR